MHQTSIDQVQGTFAGPQCQQSRYDQLPQEKLWIISPVRTNQLNIA